mmetsp:Transcript_75856/g.120190  ORF Transcript_75856/g.120190 Transcript_75856/m.120190 type:complete len:205 (-) Transcript_75856:196-810(-)
MPAKGNNAIHALILSEEHREEGFHLWVLDQHLPEEAKFRAQGQGLQSQSQHSIEVEMAEGVLSHFGSQNYSQIDTAGAIRTLLSSARLQANVLTYKLPLHFTSAKGNGHLIPFGGIRPELGTIVFNVHSRMRGSAVVAFVLRTRRACTSRGRQNQVPRPRVKNNCESLMRSAHMDLSEIGSFISHSLAILLDWNILLLQRNAMD